MERGVCWADRENRVSPTEHTMSYTASVTKTFTETAGGQPKDSLAARRGKVSLEASAFTPQFGCVPWPRAVRKLREQIAGTTHGHKPDPSSCLEYPALLEKVDHGVDCGNRPG